MGKIGCRQCTYTKVDKGERVGINRPKLVDVNCEQSLWCHTCQYKTAMMRNLYLDNSILRKQLIFVGGCLMTDSSLSTKLIEIYNMLSDNNLVSLLYTYAHRYI